MVTAHCAKLSMNHLSTFRYSTAAPFQYRYAAHGLFRLSWSDFKRYPVYILQQFLPSCLKYTGWPKNWHTFLYAFTSYAITSSNIDRFSNWFRGNICNNTVIILSTTTQVCRYTTLWNDSMLKATIENETTSVRRHFKKLTTGNNVFIVSVIIYSNCHILQFFHQMFNVSALLLDDTLLKCVFTEVVLLSIVALKTLIFHKVV